MTKRRRSATTRSVPAESPDRLLELTQEHIRPLIGLRRPMSALSAGNSNSRCSMTASSTLGRWHETRTNFHSC